MNNSKGRKQLLSDDETKEIVRKYILQSGVSKEVRSVDIYNFCKDLFLSNQLPVLPSESFWRKKDRAGRKAIDEVNKIIAHKVNSYTNRKDYINLQKLIDSKIHDLEIKNVIMNELKSFDATLNKINKELEKKEKEILELQMKNDKLDTTTQKQQYLISTMMHYFLKTSTESTKEFYKSAFNNMFSVPDKFLDQFILTETETQNNVSRIFKNRLKK